MTQNASVAKDATKKKRLWDNYKVIGEVQKSDKIKFVIAAGTRDGVRYLNIREFYFRKRDNTWNPGKDGITVPLHYPVENGTKVIRPYNDLMDVMLEASAFAAMMNLADEEHAVYMEVKSNA